MDFRNPKTQKILLVAAATGAIVYFYFFSTFVPFGHRAVAEERQELEAKYQQLSSDLSKARQILNNMEEVERQYKVLNRRWEIASSLLPEERELAELLRKVTLVGQQSGVEFQLFKPHAPLPGEVYVENSVDVRVTGGYHQVGAFLTEVANLDRIVNVSNLSLVENIVDVGTGSTVSASFVATAYTLAEAPPPSANATPVDDADHEEGGE